MMSCIFVLYLALFGTPSGAAGIRLQPDHSGGVWLQPENSGSLRVQPGSPARVLCALGWKPGSPARVLCALGWKPDLAQRDDPDALYAKRDDLASAREAAGIWAARLLKNARDFESAWKLARARYWLGGHAPAAERKALYEGGIAAGRTAVSIEPNRPEGHFWIAANMGALAESFGMRQGLKYRGDIRDELLTVLRLDPAFQHGSADRALGRWYFKVPGLFGGSDKKSEEHLRKSLTYNPNSTVSHYFLAETLLDAGRKDDARAELQKVMDAPLDPEWGPEDREWKDKARKRLTQMR